MRALGIDPGKGEFNVCLVAEGRVESTDCVVLPGYEVTDFQRSDVVKKMKAVVRKLYRDYKPDLVVAERMMVRPGRGAPVEGINLSLGFLLCLAPKGVEVRLVTPAAWKNWLKRKYGEPKEYRSCANCKKQEKCDLPPKEREGCLLWKEKEPWQKIALERILNYHFPTVHVADAAGLALYGASVLVD